ncbi:MAG: hypothetical protein U0105_04720 [Candidatus Obscuribacterales bacterium]
MTQKTIELASIDQAQELVIDERTIATYDAAQGPLTVARLVNYGTLRILGENLQEAQIVAQSIYNLGAIESDLPDLTLNAAEIKAGKGTGSFAAAGTLHLNSEGDLRVSGGTFAADVLQVTSGGKAGIHAFRLDANVKVKAKEVALGADDGNLNIVEQEIDGDPIFYQGVVTNGGNMNISVTNMPGEDVSLWAVGNITVSGPINTLGGDAQHPGRITIVGGQQKVAYNGVENDGLVPCVDCALPFPGLEIVPTPLAANTAVITTGPLTGKSVNVEGGTIITGDILVDNENIPVNFAGNCSLVAATSVKTGNVQVIKRDGATVGKGSMLASAGQNIDIGNVDGSVQAFTTQSGLIKVGNIDAGFGSVFIKAGQDFGGGGGGIIGAAAAQSFTTSLDAKIQTGTLKAQILVLLMANGNISTGTITLDPEPVSGPNSFIGPHDVRIHANIGRDTAPAFLAGGGGTNGSGQITVTNRSYVAFDGGKAGVIAISNGPNGDIHLNGNRLKCVTGDKGTPGIVADAGSGQIRLVGGSPLSVDGDASHDAGFIILMGGELRAPNAAVVSASDTQGSAETEAPTVILAVDKITLPGSLAVNCNGNTGTSIKLAPKDSAGMDIVHIDYTQPIRPQGVSPVVHELAITGAGSLSLTANSKSGSILCSGDPLRFANSGATHIESEGDDSKIELQFAGSPSGQESLIFTGGAVEVTADNPQHDGGTILVTADKVKNTASSVSMHANALSDGKGGTISLDIDRGNLSLGTAAGTMSLAATGMGSGAGGTISVENAEHNGTITLDPTFSTAALNVAALGSNGDGGHIDLHADHLVNSATGGNSGLTANGVGTGNGGHIGLRLTDSITIGGAPGLFMTAISTGSGNGGDVDIVSTQGSVTIDSASLSVTAGTDGRGGKITAKTLQSSSTLTVNGSLTANGQNTKKGGDIKVLAAGMLNISTAQFHADGGPRGAGGSVELSAGGNLTVNAGQVTALAGTLGSNKGGEISLTTTNNGNLTVNTELNADGAGNGQGGGVTLKAEGALDLSLGSLSAKGGSDGDGGTVSVEGRSVALDGTRVSVTPGTDSNGGSISIKATEDLTLSGTIDASGNGSGIGGTISLISDGSADISSAILHADGGDSDGDGGTIQITTASEVDISALATNTITARGAGSGKGGTVRIPFSSEADYLDIINITAGPDAASVSCLVACVRGGLMQVRGGVEVREWLTDFGAFPERYYSSTSLTEESAAENKVAVAASLLHPNMRTGLQNAHVNIFVMESKATYNQMFPSRSTIKSVAGITLVQPLADPQKYTFIFRTADFSGDNVPYMSGTIVHELCHSLDQYVWNNASSFNPTWTGAANTDLNDFNNNHTCQVSVDDDRTLTSQSPLACPMHPEVTLNSEKLDFFLEMNLYERFARAFAYRIYFTHQAEVSLLPYHALHQLRFPASNSYMTTMVANGQP